MIDKPKKVALCFMSYDSKVSDKQLLSLDINKLDFEIETYFRYERNPHQYQTFSQMINEAIDDTNSEFMIFINPKTIISSEDLNFIIDKLCNGYCFTSLFGFAFCGFTKELVRNIGMLDEEFLASEYEDDDYLIRMRLFNKMVYWGQDWSKYDFYKSKCQPYRGSSLTTFWRKWRWRDNTLVSSNNSKRVKYISRRHSDHNYNIKNSWKSFDDSWGEGGIWNKINSCKIIETNLYENLTDSNINIKVKFTNNSFFIEMLSDVDTAISYFLVTTNKEGRVPINMNLVYRNTWMSIPIEQKEVELRLYHDGHLIYINQINECEFDMNFNLPSSVLKNNNN